jgi:hypothetical protein
MWVPPSARSPNPADLLGGLFGFLLDVAYRPLRAPRIPPTWSADHSAFCYTPRVLPSRFPPNPAELLGGLFGFLLHTPRIAVAFSPKSRRLARRIVRLLARCGVPPSARSPNPADLLGGSFGFLLDVAYRPLRAPQIPPTCSADRSASCYTRRTASRAPQIPPTCSADCSASC